MKQASKHRSQEQEQLAAATTQQSNAREFATTEELLRHDAAQVKVPPAVATRLAQSLRDVPQPERSWWKRVFGG